MKSQEFIKLTNEKEDLNKLLQDNEEKTLEMEIRHNDMSTEIKRLKITTNHVNQERLALITPYNNPL